MIQVWVDVSFYWEGWSWICGQCLSGSPLVHSMWRSPLFFPNVKNVPAIMTRELRVEKNGAYHIHECTFLKLLQLTKGEWNDIKQSWLAMSIHQVQSHICDKKTCMVRFQRSQDNLLTNCNRSSAKSFYNYHNKYTIYNTCDLIFDVTNKNVKVTTNYTNWCVNKWDSWLIKIINKISIALCLKVDILFIKLI